MPARSVAATGTLRAAGSGEAIARAVRIVHPQILALNGVQYLVRQAWEWGIKN